MKKYEFKNVVTINFFWFPLMGLLGGLLSAYIYAEFGYRYFGVTGLYAVAIVSISSCAMVLYFLKKDIVIWFDEKYIYIKNKDKILKYAKEGVLGFYSYDYLTEKKSRISIQLKFINEKKIEITDLDYRDNYNEEKRNTLKSFIQTMQTEMNFEKIKKNKLRSFGQLGHFWYGGK
ncbi:MAG: hypothetical protein LBO65_07490 [Spirochaetaceae bacterium]|nr:hypothetical protein [Spirochaetaceae bacterium]